VIAHGSRLRPALFLHATVAILVFDSIPCAAQTNAPDSSVQVVTNDGPLTNSIPAPVQQSPPLMQSVPTPGASSGDDQLMDIRPPHFYLRDWTWVWLLLALLAMLGLLVLGGFWLLPRRQLSPKSAYELALEKLEQARALLEQESPVPYAVTVSEIIRTYLGQRFHAPSTRRTTEEFLRLMQADTTAPLAEHRGLLREFLQSCDLVKFARYVPTAPELERVQERAVSFVRATRPIDPAQQNGRA
jgi:hypothetical protein